MISCIKEEGRKHRQNAPKAEGYGQRAFNTMKLEKKKQRLYTAETEQDKEQGT